MKNKIILGLALLMGISFTGNYASSPGESRANSYLAQFATKVDKGKLSEAIDMMSMDSYKEYIRNDEFLIYLSVGGTYSTATRFSKAFSELLNKIEGNEKLIKKLITIAKGEPSGESIAWSDKNVIFHGGRNTELLRKIKEQYPKEWENVTFPWKDYVMDISSKVNGGKLSEAIDMMSKAEIDSYLNKHENKQEMISYFLNFPKTVFSKLLNKIEGNEELIKKLIATAKEDAYAIFSSPGPLGEKNPLTEKIINKYPKEWYTWESVEAVAVIDDEEENVEAVADFNQ